LILTFTWKGSSLVSVVITGPFGSADLSLGRAYVASADNATVRSDITGRRMGEGLLAVY
jgi:hypothetical protein